MKKEVHLIKKIRTGAQKLFQRNVRSLHRLHERSRVKFQRGARQRSVITFARRKQPARHVRSSSELAPIDPFTLLFWGIVIFAFFLRFYDLASKPLHHDESLYGVYCWRFFKEGGYKYDPMMHGPFMFHFQVLIFFLFGVGDFSVRIAPALLGSLMIACTYYLKDYLGRIGVIAVALFLTFSPTHLYFSRFMRHDIYIAFFTYTAVIFALRYYRTRHKKYLYLTAASLSLMFCVKENAYIHVFIFMTFIVIKDCFDILLYKAADTLQKRMLAGWVVISGITITCLGLILWFANHPLPSWLNLMLMDTPIGKVQWARLLITINTICVGIWGFVYWLFEGTRWAEKNQEHRDYTFPLLLAAFIFVWIYLFLYSTFFTNRGGVWDGLSRSWIYWWEQNRIQRIKGPFLYYVPFVFLYELPVFLIAGGGTLCCIGKILHHIANTLNKKIVIVWATIFSVYLMLHFGQRPLPSGVVEIIRMKTTADLTLSLYILGLIVWAIFFFIKREKFTFRTVFTYWVAVGFLMYTVFSVYLIRQFGYHPLPLWLSFTHMEILADLVLALYVLCTGLWATLLFIKRRETLMAFLVYWSAIGFLIYSYAGEKVPWLFLHILVPVVLLAGRLLNQFFTSVFWRESLKIVRVAVVVTGLVFGMYIWHSTVLLNYYHPVNPVERMVYTQTSTDILKMLEIIRNIKFSLGSEEAKKPIIAVQGNAVWPLSWYLRDYEEWYQPGDLSAIRRALIVINWEDRGKYQTIFGDDYQEIRVKLREWWIPRPEGTPSEWLQYFLYRKVFNPTGSSDLALYIRKWDSE